MTHPPSRLRPAASTARRSVQVSDFEDVCLLIQSCRLICDSCSSGQRFASRLPSDSASRQTPLPSANESPCRVRKGLAPSSEYALPGAQTKGGPFQARPSVLLG